MKTIYYLLSIYLLLACSKSTLETLEYDDQDSGLPKVQVLGNMITSQYPSGMPAQWSHDNEPITTFIPNSHSKIMLHGTHHLESVNGSNLVYFGIEVIEGVTRAVLFTYEGKKILSEEVDCPLMSDRHENLYAHHTDAQGNLYLAAFCSTTGYKQASYVYKVSNQLEIEKITMPVNSYFAVFNTSSSIIGLHAQYQHNYIEMTIGYSNLTRWNATLSLEGYNSYELRGAYRNFDGKVVVLVKAVEIDSKRFAYFMFFLDTDENKVTKHVLKLDNKNILMGRGYMEGNDLHLPAYEVSGNKPYTLRINTQTDLQEITATRNDLEVETGAVFGEALFIKKLDGGYYVGGTQQEKACYWVNGKLVKLTAPADHRRSYPIDLLTYRY